MRPSARFRLPRTVLPTSCILTGARLLMTASASLLVTFAFAGCGSGTQRIGGPGPQVRSKTPDASSRLGFPSLATKNTNRVAGGDPVADAAGVALAVFPSLVA